MVSKHNRRSILQPKESQRGLGLFRIFKKDTTTPLQYLAAVVIGTSTLALAVEMIWLNQHKGPDRLWSLPDAIVLLLLGLFIAHPGIIYWFRRIIFRRNHQTRSRHHRFEKPGRGRDDHR